MAYQSLYRRYRPQAFAAIRGQPHLVAALRNAVVRGSVGHAYLLHGPRGTGKTSTARVLAKALNCENLSDDGEPCCTCESCVAIEQGRSFDLHELDAAGNNRVEDMRALLAKVSLGTPGRVKVYVLDEVHMLTSAAENALLKTLEEPPDHVVWVLATTEPHKVVDTIRSRCQSFELGLLGATEMAEHVRWVVDDAGLDVGSDVVDHVVSAGGGSVRDTLSALDRVVAAGGMADLDTSTDALLDAISGQDVAAALSAVGDATGRGRDPRTIGEGVLAGLREAFLVAMGAPPPRMTPSAEDRANRIAQAMAPARITRSLDLLGRALVAMRQAPDPRVDIETALVRLCLAEPEQSAEALAEEVQRLARRLERLESGSGAARSPTRPAPAVPPSSAATPASSAAAGNSPPVVPRPPSRLSAAADPTAAAGPAAAARRTLAAKIDKSSTTTPKAPVPQTGDPYTEHPKSPTEVVLLAHRHFRMPKDRVIAKAKEMFGPDRADRSEAELARLWQAIVEAQADEAQDAAGSSSDVADAGRAAREAPTTKKPSPARVPLDGGSTPRADAAAPLPVDAAQPSPAAPRPQPEDAPAPAKSDTDEPSEPDATTDPQRPKTAAEPAQDDEIDLDGLVDAPDRVGVLVAQIQEQFPGAEHRPAEDQP